LHTKLLLFDIDGTILTSGGCGERALGLAVRDFFGAEDDLAGIEIAGRTDTHIARRLLEKYAREFSEAAVEELLGHYLRHLAALLPQIQGRVFPGIHELLKALHGRDDVVLALLTGNLVRGAELKLSHYGTWHYFAFGAFADDHFNRNELGPIAHARARERGHEIPAEHIYVLGDTPHDIACARAFGAKAIAVATGGATRARLAEHAPDALFDDFSDTAAVLRALGCD
jgi:phosphoglycolate phosphatase-like HAD superfamily hydrolase